MERWKKVDWIDGYLGVMSVSDRGHVRRDGYVYETTGRWGTAHKGRKPDKILSPYVEKNGYATIAVQISGKRKKFALHSLVARAWVPGYEAGLCVNHIDGDKANNLPSNLEWVTRARNTQHAWELGLVDLRGDANPSRKLHSGQIRIARKLLRMGATAGELAVLMRVSSSLVDKIANGKRWSSVR